jgi:hypothetical protein
MTEAICQAHFLHWLPLALWAPCEARGILNPEKRRTQSITYTQKQVGSKQKGNHCFGDTGQWNRTQESTERANWMAYSCNPS